MGPEISTQSPDCTAPSLEIEIEFPELRDGWSAASAYVQVGLLNPRRPMLLHALGERKVNRIHRDIDPSFNSAIFSF